MIARILTICILIILDTLCFEFLINKPIFNEYMSLIILFVLGIINYLVIYKIFLKQINKL